MNTHFCIFGVIYVCFFELNRFAEFMEGSFHLSDDEIDSYDSLSIKPNGTIITDDSDSIAEYSEDD